MRRVYQDEILIIISITFFLILSLNFRTYSQSIITADYYFDAIYGNDNNTGTSPNQAWKTAAKFNATTFPAGSIISFRDSMSYEGSWTLTESGTSSGRITITNWYGASSQKYPEFVLEPKITSAWTQTPGYTNIWETSAPNNYAVWFVFPDSVRWGVRESSLLNVNREFETYYENGKLYVYSPENPSTRYLYIRSTLGSSTDIYPPSGSIINISGAYITLQYINAGFSRGKGVSFYGTSSQYNEILDSKVYYCGLSPDYSPSDPGDGIYVTVANTTVKRCTTYENRGHGFYVWGGGGGNPIENVLIDSCVGYNNHHTVGVDVNSSNRTIRNVTIRNSFFYTTIATWYWKYHWIGYNPTTGAGLDGSGIGRAPGCFVKGESMGLVKQVYFINNLFADTPGPSIQTESNSDSIYIYNNTFVIKKNYGEGGIYNGQFQANNWACLTSTSNGHLTIINNSVYALSAWYNLYPIDPRAAANPENLVVTNNAVYRADGVQYLIRGFTVPTSLRTDPMYVNISSSNPANFNVHLQSSSPLIDAGTTISLFNFDKDGVARPQGSAWDIGAYEYLSGQQIGDDVPPAVLSANLIDSVTVNLTFSEPVEQSGATNPANYSIDNGISVNSVQLLNSSVVRLNTSLHNPGFYTVIVNNVTDTAGNVINPANNSAMYGYNPDPLPGLLKIIPTGTNASSIPEPEHLPEKTFDGLGYNSGDPSSRWAGTNLPQWIGYDLGDSKILNKIRIQFYKWNEGRIYNYSIMTSLDSVNWTYIKQNIYSTNTEWTEVIFDPVPVRYVRIVVHSNNQNNWASLWETEFYGQLILSNDDQSNVPENFVLEQNYPNPFNPSTKIKYSLPNNSDKKYKVSLQVYDLLGNEIAVLVDEEKEPGIYEVEFNADNLTSGIYFYRIKAGDFISTKKMILIR